MSKEVHFILDPKSELSAEQIAMIEAAKKLPPVYDEDNPHIDPVETPEQYAALLKAVADRNRRIAARLSGE